MKGALIQCEISKISFCFQMSVDSGKRYGSIRGKLTGIGGTSSGVWVYARNISVCLKIQESRRRVNNSRIKVEGAGAEN